MMTGTLAFSQQGKAALDLFVSKRVTRIFFVEDTDAEIFYERLIRKIFPRLRDFSVVCLHGKSNIIKKQEGSKQSGLEYIFIVDKDFDDLLDRVNPNLVYLDRYSIENFLLDINACISVVVEEFPSRISEQLARENCSDFGKYFEELLNRYLSISRHFIVAQRLHLEIETCGSSVEEIIFGGNEFHPMPTVEWLEGYRDLLFMHADWLNEELLDQYVQEAFDVEEAKIIVQDEFAHIPGKHVLTCVIKYLSIRSVPEFESSLGNKLYLRILNHIDADNFSSLKLNLLKKHPTLN